MPTNNSQLASIVRRIEALEAAKADTVRTIANAYAAAKADGYDVRALRAVIRLRSWDEKELADHEARVDAYSDALFAFEHTPLGQAAKAAGG